MTTHESLITLRNIFGSDLQENVRLSNFATMNVGGPADALLIAHSADQLVNMVSQIWDLNLPACVLGGGSNLLISDKGLRSVVIINHAHNIKINTHTLPHTIWAESGALMVNLGKQLIVRSLSGMEWAATIPGTVGGAVYGNIGANGTEIKDLLVSAQLFDCNEPHRGIFTVDNSFFHFKYRHSILKEQKNLFVCSVTLELQEASYQEIMNGISESISMRLKREPKGSSAGSTFKNPSPEQSAGMLIDKCGLKGTKVGGAMISEKHANWLINMEHAMTRDFKELINLMKEKVKKRFGIELEEEIQIIESNSDIYNLPNFSQ